MAKVRNLVALAAFMVVGAIFASPALANDMPQTAAQLPPTVTFQVAGATVSTDDVATGKVTILGYIKAKGESKKVIRKAKRAHKCITVPAGTPFTNSGLRGAPGFGWFTDTSGAVLCHTGNGPTGWQKVGKKKAGDEHNCGNWAIPPKVHKHVTLIQGKVIVVRSLARVHIILHAIAIAQAACKTDNSNATANGSGSADVNVTLSVYLKSQGTTVSNVYGQAYAKASADASAKVTCASEVQITPVNPPVTPPPGCQKNCTSPPPPVKHMCSLTVGNAGKGNPYTANASVSSDSAAMVVVNWGDGQVTGPGSHTYPTPPESPNAGDGVSYTISATASFADGQTVNCGSKSFFVPAPPPGGNTDPPPLPPG
jgi:hypothetical protein